MRFYCNKGSSNPTSCQLINRSQMNFNRIICIYFNILVNIKSCPKNERSFEKTWIGMVQNGILDNTAPYMHWVRFIAFYSLPAEYYFIDYFKMKKRELTPLLDATLSNAHTGHWTDDILFWF